MNKPNLELKNIKTFRGMEGTGLNADLFINGLKCYFVMDDANGGCYNYQSTAYNNPKADEVNANIKLLDEYIASLPEEPMIIDGKPYVDAQGKTHTLKKDLDWIVDELFNAVEKEKAAKKMQKLFETAIVFGVPDANEYRYCKYKHPLKSYLKDVMQKEIDRVKEKCVNGVVILNTNLKEFGV